jgi:hypothetical protein
MGDSTAMLVTFGASIQENRPPIATNEVYILELGIVSC